MFSKWFIVCAILSSLWVYLTVAGRGIFKDSPLGLAWMLPLGPSAWEQTTKEMASHGMPLSEVIRKLGQPDQVSEPLSGGNNIQYLRYVNPHDSSRFVVVTIGPDGKVINASSGGDSNH